MYVGQARLIAFTREPESNIYVEVLHREYKKAYYSPNGFSNYGIIYGPNDLNINSRVQYVAQLSGEKYDRIDWESLIRNHVRYRLPSELVLTYIYDFYYNSNLWPAFLSALSKLDKKFNIEMHGSFVGSPGIIPLFSFEGSPYALELAFENEDDKAEFEVILRDAF